MLVFSFYYCKRVMELMWVLHTKKNLIAGGSEDSAAHAGPSTVAGVATSRESTDEAYARELGSKLEKKGTIKLKTCPCSGCCP